MASKKGTISLSDFLQKKPIPRGSSPTIKRHGSQSKETLSALIREHQQDPSSPTLLRDLPEDESVRIENKPSDTTSNPPKFLPPIHESGLDKQMRQLPNCNAAKIIRNRNEAKSTTKYKALFDSSNKACYNPHKHLNFLAGDVILKYDWDTSHTEWWFGKLVKTGEEGIFPRIYVQKLDPNAWKQKARIKFDHNKVAENELCLKAGDIVTIKEENDDPYWEAEFQGRVGIFPSDWAQVISSSYAKELQLAKYKEPNPMPVEDQKDDKAHQTPNTDPDNNNNTLNNNNVNSNGTDQNLNSEQRIASIEEQIHILLKHRIGHISPELECSFVQVCTEIVKAKEKQNVQILAETQNLKPILNSIEEDISLLQSQLREREVEIERMHYYITDLEKRLQEAQAPPQKQRTSSLYGTLSKSTGATVGRGPSVSPKKEKRSLMHNTLHGTAQRTYSTSILSDSLNPTFPGPVGNSSPISFSHRDNLKRSMRDSFRDSLRFFEDVLKTKPSDDSIKKNKH